MCLVMVSMQVVQAHVPQGPGRYQKACIIITDLAVYLAQNGERHMHTQENSTVALIKLVTLVQALEYVRYSQYNSVIHFFSLSL